MVKTWPFQGLLVTSNVWGWKGHSLNHLDCITIIFLKQFLSGSKGPEDVFGSFQRCPPPPPRVGFATCISVAGSTFTHPKQEKQHTDFDTEKTKNTLQLLLNLKLTPLSSFSWLQYFLFGYFLLVLSSQLNPPPFFWLSKSPFFVGKSRLEAVPQPLLSQVFSHHGSWRRNGSDQCLRFPLVMIT